MTKLAEQLRQKMPAVADSSRLNIAAIDALRGHRNPMVAHDGFTEKVLADAGLLVALVGREEVSRLALRYLQKVRADMVQGGAVQRMGEGAGQGRNDAHIRVAPSSSAPLPGEGQAVHGAQYRSAQPRQPVEGGSGQVESDAHGSAAAPPSPPLHGDGHLTIDAHCGHARSMQPHDSSGGQGLPDAQLSRAPAAVAPKELSRAAIAARGASAKVVALTILDTHRLSNGVAIGDVYWGSLHRLRNASARDAALCRQLINMGVADPHKKVREIVTVEQMQLMIQKAAEIADAM